MLIGLLLLVISTCSVLAQPYKNKLLPPEERAKDLLGRMSLDEKIGQMTQLCASSITLDGTKKLDLNLSKIRSYIIQEHVGSFLSGTGKAEKWIEFIRGIQEVAVKETRLGIPILFGMDNVHGSNYTDEGTMLPHNLTLSCSFDAKLAYQAAQLTALESIGLGHIWNFAPVLDVGKNPWWPRLYETFGEDPLVCARFGSAFVSGFQAYKEKDLAQGASCAKHFIGYSDPKSSWDRTPSEIPDQQLYEVFVPPFRAAFRAGVKTLMVNSGELNGEPVHGSKKWLHEQLRKNLGFDGVVLTDIKDILKMVEMHRAYENEEDATLAAIDAGIDMSMACSNTDFIRIMKKLVTEGKISENRINQSVQRILKLKFELGLFEFPYPKTASLKNMSRPEHYRQALEAAKESIVMLENQDVLPLKPEMKHIAIAGPGAHSRRMLNGAWTLEWLGAEEERQPAATVTLLEALKKKLPQSKWTWTDSVGFDRKAKSLEESTYFQTWKNEAEKADILVLALGEWPYSEFKGNASDLMLDEKQTQLLQYAQATGKPLIVILMEGRPRVLPKLRKDKMAVLFAGHPGMAGGEALAEIMIGSCNPSGKLSFTYPKNTVHTLPYYHKMSDKYEYAWPFGHGLHFGDVNYNSLQASDSTFQTSDSISISISVSNNSKMSVKEAVLLFQTDEVGRITRPASQLVDFKRVELKPGESRKIRFQLLAKDLCTYPDGEGREVTEPGFHRLRIGSEQIRIRLKK